MQRQSTSTIVMVPPDHFGFNPQTAETNPYQHTQQAVHSSTHEIREEAQLEFAQMIQTLRRHGVNVLVLPNRPHATTPDAVFPNNWFSHHQDGKLVLYPLLTPNRRQERQPEALLELLHQVGIKKPEIIDLTKDEEKGLFLESTGSMIFDRMHNVAFAMASARTVKEEFEKWCELMHYEGVYLDIAEQHQQETYHTNIHMCIGTEFVIVCLEVLESDEEKEKVREKINSLRKECIEILLDQVYQFCGNVLELQAKDGKKLLVMSETAQKGFTKEQLSRLSRYVEIVPIAIPTIEAVGGGGVRCMMAEVFPS